MPISDPLRNPAQLFVELWAVASQWTNTQRSVAPEPPAPFDAICAGMLEADDGAAAYDQLHTFLFGKKLDEPTHRGRVLATMAAIDLSFYAIHPRALDGRTPVGPASIIPEWLRDLRGYRRWRGHYFASGSDALLPRGPLLRDPRHAVTANAESLFDRFAALTVTPLSLEHQDRPIAIRLKTIDHDPHTGVKAGPASGAETIGYVPLAIEPGDLEVHPQWATSSQLMVDYRVAAGIDIPGRAAQAITELGSVDLVIMPELVPSCPDTRQIGRLLAEKRIPRPRMTIAGSCLTTDCEEGLPWNECRVFNHAGVQLWEQRKLWPAGLDEKTAVSYGLPSPGSGKLALENTACGDAILLTDVDGMGRCLVLICQDLHLTLAGPLIEAFQPDWIFVPILDYAIGAGRWAHAGSFKQSDLSQARYIAITSTALGSAYDPAKPAGMGIAVGPKQTQTAGDIDRAFLLVPRPAPGTPGCAKLQWRAGAWEQTVLGTKSV